MKAKVIAIANNKGGVGKTSLVTNLGASLALRGYKTLLIDLDGQSNLTDAFIEESKVKASIAGALRDGKELPIVPIKHNLFLVPSNAQTDALKEELAILSDAIKFLIPSYDFILIDTPPSVGILTISALMCASEVIIPIEAELSSFKGLNSMCKLIEKAQNRNNRLNILAIVLCFYDERRRLSKVIVNAVEKNFQGLLCKSTIRRNVAVAEAALERTDIYSYSPKSKGASDYSALTEEILERLDMVQN